MVIGKGSDFMAIRLDHQAVLELLPDREPWSHKGDYGKILLLCGSRGYTGAAYLSAMGALRSGAGLVYLGVPESIYTIEAIKLDEAVVFPLPERAGMFSREAIPRIQQRLAYMDAVLIGPGIGQSEDTLAVTSFVMDNAPCPVVLDADGINVLAAHRDILRGRKAPTILTPHQGEFRRLGGQTGQDSVKAAEIMARELECILVLKGHESCITDGKNTYINTTGNPGMAVGGSGDLLAGIITAFLGQGISPLEAAACGVWVHGAAGDLCARDLGEYGMLPTDMMEVLPRLLK